jgi:hypothetical protein
MDGKHKITAPQKLSDISWNEKPDPTGILEGDRPWERLLHFRPGSTGPCVVVVVVFYCVADFTGTPSRPHYVSLSKSS